MDKRLGWPHIPFGFGEVSIVYSSFMLLMSYRYIWSSNMTTSRFLFIRTANTVVGKVSSHIVDCLCKK